MQETITVEKIDANSVKSKMEELKQKKELYRRLPEIRLIQNVPLREKVVDAFLNHCPSYFWTAPASSSGNHHQDDVCGKHGLWIHCKRTFACYERHVSTFEEMSRINSIQADYGRAGILLHDLYKYGRPPRGKHTVEDHDVIAARILETNTDLPEEVIECIHSHNGAWYEGKTPETDLELVHHIADMGGSAKNCVWKVYKPCKEILEVIEEEPGVEAKL